ncbi:growth factor receptor-bound protein 7-like [Rhinoraja longicauda]
MDTHLPTDPHMTVRGVWVSRERAAATGNVGVGTAPVPGTQTPGTALLCIAAMLGPPTMTPSLAPTVQANQGQPRPTKANQGLPWPPEQQAVPPEQQAVPPEQQAVPTEQQAVPPEQQAVPPEQQAVPPEQQAVPPEQQAVPPEQQAVPPEQQAVPPEQQAVPPEQQAVPPEQQAVHTIIMVFSEEGMRRSLEVRAAVIAHDVCCLLVDRHRCVDTETWALVECHPDSALERCLEDHELPVEIQSTWPVNSKSKFIFRKHYAKYEFFRNPQTFFPMHLLAGSLEADAGIPQAQLTQNVVNARSCPEIQGYLHLKEKGKKTWRRLYFFLRRSGFYYSTKGTSKEPRHLQYFADVNENNIYTVTSRTMHNSPTDYGFCVKGAAERGLGLLCSDDEQSRKCWLTTFRLLKLGPQLCLNYQLSQQKKAQKSWVEPVGRGPETCLVPMDFSGCTGRVIENPSEASLVAEEEGQAWRQKKGAQRHSLPSLYQDPALSTEVHKSQAWFHGRISREEAHRLIVQHGHIDGVFLMRESQRTPKSFVLTLSHHHKTKHFLVAPCEEDGQMFFTVDTGQTRFSDLIQLVDFYQINRGALPCSLKHYCTRVAL